MRKLISSSAIQYSDLQGTGQVFPKLFPKSLDKLLPNYFNKDEKEAIEHLLNSLNEPKSAKELASIMTCSTRTLKDKYLNKMLQVGVIAMTIPDKPTSSKLQYKLIVEE